MGIFTWLGKKIKNAEKKDPRANHEFNAEDREMSAEIRRIRAERKRLQELQQLEEERAELEDLRAELRGDDDEDDDDDDPLLKIALPFLTQLGQPQSINTPPPMEAGAQGQETIHLDDTQLKELLSQVKAPYLALAKAMPESALRQKLSEFSIERLGAIPDHDTLTRAITMLKS